jgi:formamidopyrimidine-DNA glycosylase
MPELPEVESVRRGLSPLVGAEISPNLLQKTPERFKSAQLAAGTVESVSRRGKWLVIGVKTPSSPKELIVHLGMTGKLLLLESQPTDLHLHALWSVVLKSNSTSWLAYIDPRRFGKIEWVDKNDYSTLPGLSTLGPEATEPDLVKKALMSMKKSGRPIKAILLDQSVIAGSGNIYCDEALFSSKIHPARPCASLSEEEIAVLSEELSKCLNDSIKLGGTTFRDYRRPDGTSGSNQKELRCYGRGGLPCFVCSTLLKVSTISGRTSAYCPSCQDLRPRKQA